MGRLWVGTSGYSYKHWAGGVFYPRGLPSGKWFRYYLSQFGTVELNVTFYRLPKPETFRNWRRNSPAGFRFFVKGSRYITHLKRLKAPAPALRALHEVVSPLKEKLAGVLWQLPPRFRRDDERLKRFLEALKKFKLGRQVFEFRDESWFNQETVDLLGKYGAAMCEADGHWPYGGFEVPKRVKTAYLRRHGVHPIRKYFGTYSDEQIARDARRAAELLRAGKEVFVYYNNDPEGYAPKDAKRLEAAASRLLGAGLKRERARGDSNA